MRYPRHPLYWPKMKIRGARRKRLAAHRTQSIVFMRVRFIDAGDGVYHFLADPNGTHMIEAKQPWRDGFGRAVPAP